MTRKFEVILSAEAEANIDEAYQWIAEANQSAADRWYAGLIAALKGLAELPLRCPIAPETRLGLIDREVRQLLYGRSYWKYRILFAVDARKILILHVRHGARLYLGQELPEDEAGED